MLKLYKHRENKSIILSENHHEYRKNYERRLHFEMSGNRGMYGGFGYGNMNQREMMRNFRIPSLALVNPNGEKSKFNFFDVTWEDLGQWKECDDKIFFITTVDIDRFNPDLSKPFIISTRDNIFFNSLETKQILYLTKRSKAEDIKQLEYRDFTEHIIRETIIRDNLEFKNFNYKRHREEMKSDRIQNKMFYQQVYQQRVEDREHRLEVERQYYNQLHR